MEKSGGVKRTEAHRIDTKGQAILAQALPPDFVARRLDPDYGLDYEVEIFDGDSPTGLHFYVQLKSVAATKSPPSIRLELSHLAYWASQTLPVLLVVADVGTESLWSMWTNDLDSFSAGAKQRTKAFRLDPSAKWNSSTPGRLHSDVAAFRRFRERAVVWPIGLAVLGIEGEAVGLSPESARDLLRPLVANVGELLHLRPAGETQSGDLRIECRSTSTRFATIAARHVVIDHASESPPLSGNDLLVLCGLALLEARQYEQAAQIVSASAGRSSLWAYPFFSHLMAQALIAGGRAGEALSWAQRLVGAGNDADASAVAVLTAVCQSNGDSTLDPQELRSVMEARFDGLVETQKREAAHAAYNLANFFRCNNEPTDAIVWLRRASAAWPEYERLGYWHRELGGALFLTAQFDQAADAYARAVELDDDFAKLPLLLGDSLFRAGRYGEAITALERPSELEGSTGAFARILSGTCSLIVETTGLVSQVQPEADRVVDTSDESAALGSVHEWALNSWCWLVLGAGKQDDPRYGAAAAIALYEPWLWAGALLSALAVGWTELAADCASTARHYVGYGVLDSIVEIAEGAEMSELVAGARDLYDRATPLPSEPFVTRLFELHSAPNP